MRMSNKEYREILTQLGLNQRQAGELLSVSLRSAAGYARRKVIPEPTALLLRMLCGLATKRNVAKIIQDFNIATKELRYLRTKLGDEYATDEERTEIENAFDATIEVIDQIVPGTIISLDERRRELARQAAAVAKRKAKEATERV